MTTQEEPQVDNVGHFDVTVDRGNKTNDIDKEEEGQVNWSHKQKDLILDSGSKDNEEQMITGKQPQVDKGDKIDDTDLQEKAGGINNTNETDVVLAVNISISQLSYFNYSSDSSSKVKSGGKNLPNIKVQ